MSRIGKIWTAIALFAIALSLSFYFFEYRSERIRCAGVLDYDHCIAGTPNTLLVPLRLIGRGPAIPYADPPLAFFMDGIYSRRGYSSLAAKIGGLAAPALLSCLAAFLVVRGR